MHAICASLEQFQDKEYMLLQLSEYSADFLVSFELNFKGFTCNRNFAVGV